MSKDNENTETRNTQLYGFSKPFLEISACKLRTSEELADLSNKLIDQIIDSFSIIKLNYDGWRAEYNENLPTNERLFVTPYLKISSGARRNIYLQWVRICSQSFLGKTNHGDKWQPREIKRGTKNTLYYTEKTLKSALSSYTKKCLPYLMDAEHSLIYLRQQLAIVKNLFEISRSIKPEGYGHLLAKKKNNNLNHCDEQKLLSIEDQLLYLKASFDPLSLSKSLTKIQFSEPKKRDNRATQFNNNEDQDYELDALYANHTLPEDGSF